MSHCYEIVQFRFAAGVEPEAQHQAMKVIGGFAQDQPGFIERRYFHDPKTQRWIDLVTWRSAADAERAMAAFAQDPRTAPMADQFDAASVQAGHYDLLGSG